MVETALFFVLGFLSAGFLALLVAPSLWRRASALARRRTEATAPLTVDEIQADKDRLRAEFAIATRRLEMSVKALKEKVSRQAIEANRSREEMRRLAGERETAGAKAAEQEKRIEALEADLAGRGEELGQAVDRLGVAEALLEERQGELEELSGLLQEASINASSYQIDLVARESEVEKLKEQIQDLRAKRKEAEARVREANAESRTALEDAKREKKRAADLEARLAKVTASISDQEEKFERREREMLRKREQLSEAGGWQSELEASLKEERALRESLEEQLGELSKRMTALISGATAGDIEQAVTRLGRERERLQERLTGLLQDNLRLRNELLDARRTPAPAQQDAGSGDEQLREEIHGLAAQMVSLVAQLDDEQSPIRRILSEEGEAGAAGPLPSLADRVKRLREEAAARTP